MTEAWQCNSAPPLSADAVVKFTLHKDTEGETEALNAEESAPIVLVTSGRAGMQTPSLATVMTPGMPQPLE